MLMKFSCSQYEAFQQPRRLKALCSIHLYQHLSCLCFVHVKKVIFVCSNFLVIVLRNHFNFRVIIWSWQHMRVHTSLPLARSLRWLKTWTPSVLSLLLTVAFSVKSTCIKEISTVLESIRRSPWTIDRARSKRTIIAWLWWTRIKGMFICSFCS